MHFDNVNSSLQIENNTFIHPVNLIKEFLDLNQIKLDYFFSNKCYFKMFIAILDYSSDELLDNFKTNIDKEYEKYKELIRNELKNENNNDICCYYDRILKAKEFISNKNKKM